MPASFSGSFTASSDRSTVTSAYAMRSTSDFCPRSETVRFSGSWYSNPSASSPSAFTVTRMLLRDAILATFSSTDGTVSPCSVP